MVEITNGLWDIITNLATMMTAIAAVVHLGFTVYQFHKNNQTLKSNKKQQRENNRMRELRFVNTAFQQIISTEERLFYEVMKKGGEG